MRHTGFYRPGLVLGIAFAAMALSAVETGLPAAPLPSVAGPVLLDHQSPVEKFRGLMAMSAAERERALAGRTAADRALVLAKLQEYEALPSAVREARLCQTELHWEMSGLMRLPPGARSGPLQQVSPLYRPMIESLLQEWDQMPPAMQKDLVEKQSFISFYLRLQGSPASVQQEILGKLPPQRRAHWAAEMDRWQALPEAQRTELCAQFQRFCSMGGQEQKKTVAALSAEERQEMEKALQSFNRLPTAQRAVCINSFGRFATMAADERSQFLKNAAHWEAMTPEERQLWRELVHILPPMPPMPPGFPSGLPPMPPGFPGFPPNVTTPVIMAQQGTNDLR